MEIYLNIFAVVRPSAFMIGGGDIRVYKTATFKRYGAHTQPFNVLSLDFKFVSLCVPFFLLVFAFLVIILGFLLPIDCFGQHQIAVERINTQPETAYARRGH